VIPSATAISAATSPNHFHPHVSNEIELLFAQVNALALRLRHRGSLGASQGALLPAETLVLNILAQAGPQTVPQIARARTTSRQNIQIMVNRLEREGFVESVPNPAHRRSLLVALTERGRERLEIANKIKVGFIKDIGKHVSEVELQDAIRLLQRLNDLLSGKTGASTERKPSNASKPKKQRTTSTSALAIQNQNESDANELPVSLL